MNILECESIFDTNEQLSKVVSRYGAQMGRRNYTEDYNGTVRLFRITFEDHDYDKGGAYWGGNEPLYAAIGEGFEKYIRAKDLRSALIELKKDYPELNVTFNKVDDDFVHAYMDAILFSSIDDDQEFLDSNYTVQDFSPETLTKIINDCCKFVELNFEDIKENMQLAGHDFLLTRNECGAGFWDGDWDDEVGERLTQSSKNFGHVDFYVGDDKLIYCM
jgi:hypothetical protein